MADNDVINGFLGDIGFSIKSVTDKVKDTVSKGTEMAKQVSPQYQAGKAALDQFKGGMKTVKSTTPSGRTISRRVPASSGTAIPTTGSNYKGRFTVKDLLSRLSKKRILKIPVLYYGIGVAVLMGLPFLRRLGRKK